MKKNLLIVFLGGLVLLSAGLGVYCIKLNKKIEEFDSNNKTIDNNTVNDNADQIALDCSFTRTYFTWNSNGVKR